MYDGYVSGIPCDEKVKVISVIDQISSIRYYPPINHCLDF